MESKGKISNAIKWVIELPAAGLYQILLGFAILSQNNISVQTSAVIIYEAFKIHPQSSALFLIAAGMFNTVLYGRKWFLISIFPIVIYFILYALGALHLNRPVNPLSFISYAAIILLCIQVHYGR